jgi:CheY-like chemotaxis protein
MLEIDCAENGEAAVRMFSDKPDRYDIIFMDVMMPEVDGYDLILMDVQMPKVDGYEATRRIRAFEAKLYTAGNTLLSGQPKEVPIIAMTANVFNEDIEKCLDAGMNDHLGKPINFTEGLEKLRHYLF